jgi:hypothetical protein
MNNNIQESEFKDKNLSTQGPKNKNNLSRTPPPKKRIVNKIDYNRYMNDETDGLINPFKGSLFDLLKFCDKLIESIKELKFYNSYAFSGSFGVYLYKQYLHYKGNTELDLDSWKPKDIDIVVDKNVKDIMNNSSNNKIKSLSRREKARNFFIDTYFISKNGKISEGGEQIIQYKEEIEKYKIVNIDLVPVSAGKGDLKDICYLKFDVNGEIFVIPILPFAKILDTKLEQIKGYPENSINKNIRNKHRRVKLHIENLNKISYNTNKLEKLNNINCIKQNNIKNNVANSSITAIPFKKNNNDNDNNQQKNNQSPPAKRQKLKGKILFQ